MTSEEKSRLLIHQQELLAAKERENAELHAKLDRLIESQNKSQEAMASMTASMSGMASELKELRLSNAAKDRKIQSLRELLSRNNPTMFGSRSQKAKASKATKSREKDKDDFDDSGDSINPENTEDRARDNGKPAKAHSEAQLRDDHPPRGELMDKAVRYLDTFWRQVFRYLENGRYSIDNNIAERYIRPLAGERKNSLFFGSDKMARASAIYHTVISTCRMSGISAVEYLKKFFRKVVEGERDYSLLTPQAIGLSYKNC